MADISGRDAVLIQVIVTPYFNAAATMGFIDPFRAANYLKGCALFRWTLLSEAGGAIPASNGVEIATAPLAGLREGAGDVAGDVLVISSSWEPEAHASARICAVLRTAARRQVPLCALDTGAFILARAGLLKGYSATVHYEHLDAFTELFPDTEVTDSLWVNDRGRITCCGGVAALDLALHMIRQKGGAALANAAGAYVFASPLRGAATPQYTHTAGPLGFSVPDRVRAAIRVMEANLEDPLPITALCGRIGLSHRQLDRLFARYVRKTPALYYRDMRLDRARGLVTQTGLPLSEVACASGFAGQAQFSRAYKERFGLSPGADRVQGRIPFEFRAWPMHRAPKPAAR
ncbi:MAG: GlxA family transcriptional regulator [Rhodobacteraceae bacterium]|nr:GlxA family transcriptional regulator [Paracoccaceae bacterium]